MVDTIRRLAHRGRRASKEYELTWRYVTNLAPSLRYRFGGRAPAGEAARVLHDLNRDGIARTTVAALLGDTSGFRELCGVAERLLNQQEREIAAARLALAGATGRQSKPFLWQVLGAHPAIEETSLWGRFALQGPILDVVNAYYGMFVRLRHYNVWYNLRTRNEATESQLWHRDPEDRYILKVFVALRDVVEGSGPFVYAPGTHSKGPITTSPEACCMDGQTPRSDDAQMAAVVPRERWVTGTGLAGTILFADTRGYHKGGLARDRDRLLYVAEFTSVAAGGGGIPSRH